MKRGYIAREYRAICRAAWGDFPNDWHVHHIDHGRCNNRPGNLLALPRDVHYTWHYVAANAPAHRPDSPADIEHWCERATRVYLLMPTAQRCRAWAGMLVQLPPWLGAEFGAVELPATRQWPQHWYQFTPELKRFLVCYARAKHRLTKYLRKTQQSQPVHISTNVEPNRKKTHDSHNHRLS